MGRDSLIPILLSQEQSFSPLNSRKQFNLANSISQILNVVTSGVRIKYVYHGMGRHILDPSISKPHDILQYSYYLYIGQVINLIAVTLLKWSICAYLLALPFGLIYKIVVWLSVAMVLVFNLTMPMLGLFGCRPFEANWNKGMKGKCFYKGGQAITYVSIFLARRNTR